MSKIFAIVKGNLLDIFRDLKSNAVTFLLPAIFMLVFGFLFSKTHEISTWSVGLIESTSIYEELSKQLELINDESEEPVFEIKKYDKREEAIDDIKTRDLDILITDVEDDTEGDSTKPKFYFDEGSQRSGIAVTVVKDILSPKEEANISYESVLGRDNLSGFELMVSGLIIYGILIIIPQVAGTISRINEKNYLLRYAVSKTTAFELITGFTISHLIVGAIQVFLLCYFATWFGLKLDTYTLQAFIFIIPVTFFSIGTGMLIGAFFDKGEGGQNIGIMLSVILGFLSGSFIVGIERIGFDIAGRFVAITDFIPTFYAYRGMTSLIVYNSDFSSVTGNLLVISSFSIIIYLIGILSYNKKNLQIG
ncbi:MAG TPA: ABC transporter permease [bacterium]|nr:ABC transporter permease [bacterium]